MNCFHIPDTRMNTNTIGDPLMIAYWKDPDFDPAQKAFYYVRVLEIPKPSWQACDAKYYGVQMSDEVPMIVQDRAYTSPIWYTPLMEIRIWLRWAMCVLSASSQSVGTGSPSPRCSRAR